MVNWRVIRPFLKDTNKIPQTNKKNREIEKIHLGGDFCKFWVNFCINWGGLKLSIFKQQYLFMKFNHKNSSIIKFLTKQRFY